MNLFFLGSLFFTTLAVFTSTGICEEQPTISEQPTQVKLTPKNSLLIRGAITEKTATEFIHEVNKRPNKKGLIVYIDTNGGEVDAGNKIVGEIQKYNISCVAHKAISMGFVILQSCNVRYITPLAVLMQHQMSYGVGNEKEKVESYVDFIRQIGDELIRMQAMKINITEKDMKERTFNDWWLFGKNAIVQNCADKMAIVKCNCKLTNETYLVDKGAFTFKYSKCPLVSGPIEKIPNPNGRQGVYFL